MKYALIIANNKYEDQKLAQLNTPQADARALTKILRAKKIGNFDEVTTLIDPKEVRSRRAINDFLSNKKPDDLVLIYFSGHGVLDSRGNLFLALKDTQVDSLSATALPSSFISYEMDNCRSRRQILILDCCHSGAFERGAKGNQTAITESTFEGSGSGRVVLTASDSTQVAFEGDRVIGQTSFSLFTHFLLEGLKTGEADLNNDGKISLDEWYDYCHAKITATTPKQIPHKWSYHQQGELFIAQNPFKRKQSTGVLSHPLRVMLDQKLLDYRQHKLLLDSKELEIIAAELENGELDVGDADKHLFLFSALANGGVHQWLELSGAKGLEWLREACHDENCPQEVRRSASAHLGKLEDGPTYAHLLDCAQSETKISRRSDWLDLLTHYVNGSGQSHRLPWTVRRALLPRLANLRLREGAKERGRISRVAGLTAPICALIAFILSRTSDPVFNVIGAVVVILIAAILAIAFAQGITSLALVTRRWPLVPQALIMVGVGSAFGAILFLFLANQMIVGFSGGVIALIQSLVYRGKPRLSAIHWALLAALLIVPFTVLMTHQTSLLAKTGYAFSAGLFSCIYVYSAGNPRSFRLS